MIGYVPALKRASTWKGWMENGLMTQLAGHLRGRALQEWDLLSEIEKDTFESAVEALRKCLDHGGKVLTAQRHDESVSDFI